MSHFPRDVTDHNRPFIHGLYQYISPWTMPGGKVASDVSSLFTGKLIMAYGSFERCVLSEKHQGEFRRLD